MCNVIICKDRDQNKDFSMAGHGIFCSSASSLREDTLFMFLDK